MASEQSPATAQHDSPSSTAPCALSTSTPSRPSHAASSASNGPYSHIKRSSGNPDEASGGSEAGGTIAFGATSSGGSEEGEFEYVAKGGMESAWKDVSQGEVAGEKCQIDVSTVSPASPPPSPVTVKTSPSATSRAGPRVYSKWAPPGYVPSTSSPAPLTRSTPTPASSVAVPSTHAASKPEVDAKQATLAKMRALLPPKEPAAVPSTPSTQPIAPSHSYPPSPPSPRTTPKLTPTPLFERIVESTIHSNTRNENHEMGPVRRQLEQELILSRDKLTELAQKLEEGEKLLQRTREEAVAREKKQDEIVESARRQVQVLKLTVSRLEGQVEQYKADVAVKQNEVDSLEFKLREVARELVYSDDYLDERKKEISKAQDRLRETTLELERACRRITELETLVELRDLDVEDAHKQADIVDAKLQSAQEKLDSTTERCQKAEKLAIKRQKELDKLLQERAQLEADLAAAQESPKSEDLFSPVERDKSDSRIADYEARLDAAVEDKKKVLAEFDTLRFHHQQLGKEHEALKSASSQRIAELEAEKKVIELRASHFAAQAVKAKEELKKRMTDNAQPGTSPNSCFVYSADQLLVLAESPAIPTLAPGSLPSEIDANKPKVLYEDPQAPVTMYMQMCVRYASLRDRYVDLEATVQRLKREKMSLEEDNAGLKQEAEELRSERDHAYDLVQDAAQLLDAHVDHGESSTPSG